VSHKWCSIELLQLSFCRVCWYAECRTESHGANERYRLDGLVQYPGQKTFSLFLATKKNEASYAKNEIQMGII